MIFLNPGFTFLTENVTGLTEIRRIQVPVTDPNNAEECKDTDDCEKDEIYYFIFGEYIFVITQNN
jgi:hypothetical protein